MHVHVYRREHGCMAMHVEIEEQPQILYFSDFPNPLAGLTSEAQRLSASLTLVLPTHDTTASVYGPNSSPLSCKAGTLHTEPLR